MSGTTGRRAFCEMTVFSSHCYRNDVLFYRQIFKTPISPALFVRSSWNFAQRSSIIISHYSRKKISKKLMTSAEISNFHFLLINADVINFLKKFLLEKEDIDKLNLCAKFQICWKNKSRVISNSILCWRQQKWFWLIFSKMAENRILAQPFLKNSRFFQSFIPSLKIMERVEQLGKYDIKLAEKFAQTIICLKNEITHRGHK